MTVVVVDPESNDSDETNTVTTLTTTVRTSDKTNKAPLEGSTTGIMSAVDGNNSSLTVAIVLPVIICALFVAAFVTFYMWRRKRSASTVINETARQEQSVPDEVFADGQPYQPESCYAVRPTEKEVQDEMISDGYSSIDETAAERDKTHLDRSYNHVSQTDIQFVNQGYSHIKDSKVREQVIPDNLYTQVNKVLKTQEDETDDSYNKLNNKQTSNTIGNLNTNTVVENKDMDGEKSGYNHWISGRSNPEVEGEGYSHLNKLQ